MAQTCKNCNTCTCTGTKITLAKDGRSCCSACVNRVNAAIDQQRALSEQKEITHPKAK